MDTMIPPAPDYAAIKTRQNAAWASGDYARIGTTLQITGETLAEAMDLPPGARVLDVAAGNGNATLAFARRWCAVTSTDYVETLLARGRARAEAEGLDIAWQMADAERLPFAAASFDAVVSTFGVMFAPDHPRAAAELLRVIRPGGRIGLANWTPAGFIGQLFRVVAAHVPPPAGLKSPMLWGDEAHIVGLFGNRASAIRADKRVFNFRYRSPEHFVEVFRAFYGPTNKAFAALDDKGQATLRAALLALLEKSNVGGGKSLVVPAEYLEVVISR